MTLDQLARTLVTRFPSGSRHLIAVAGAPGSGKSTSTEALARLIGERAMVLPMDGFHHDNAWLDARGLRARKGAPDTFDVDALATTLRQVRQQQALSVPAFDRAIDAVVPDALAIEPSHDLIFVEGNYVLADAPPWSGLAPLFDARVMVEADLETLRQRLIKRWRDLGLDEATVTAKVEHNDLVNARWVIEHSQNLDYRLHNG